MQVVNIDGSAALRPSSPGLFFFSLDFRPRLHAAAGDESGTAPAWPANPATRPDTVCSRMMSRRAVIGWAFAVAIDNQR